MIKTELMNVTPALAREWLKKNTDNRRLRPGVVNEMAIAYARGEWKLTHQGIAFGSDGRLLDGQHRLTFISQLPEGTRVQLFVTSGMDPLTFDAIDQGARRTPADVLGISLNMSAAGRFFARIANGGQGAGLTVQYCAPFVEWITPEYEELVTFCSKHANIWSSSAIRCAAIYQMKRGHDADYIKQAYWSLVHADIDSMPYAARAVMQQHMSGKIVSSRTTDLFCRGLRVFDSFQRGRITKILIKDMAGTMAEVRQFVVTEMKKSPAKAGQSVAKPAVHSKPARIVAVA